MAIPTVDRVDGQLDRATRGSALRIVHLGASVVLTFLFTPYLIRELGDRSYGLWLFVASFVGYAGVLDLGLASAVSRHLAAAFATDDRRESTRIFGTALRWYTAVAGFTAMATCVISAAGYAFAGSPQDAWSFSQLVVGLGLTAALQLGQQPFTGVLQARERFDIIAWLDLLALGIRFALLYIAVALGYGVVALGWVALVSASARSYLAVVVHRRTVPWLRFEPQPFLSSTSRRLFGYSSYTVIAQCADNLRVNTDSLVITSFLGLAAVTPFGVAAGLVQKFRDLMMALTGVLQPVYTRLDASGRRPDVVRTLLLATKISVAVSMGVGFALVAWGKPFLALWVPRHAEAGYPVLVILSLAWTVNSWQSPGVSMLYATSHHHWYAGLNVIEAAANLALSLLWVQSLGIVGVALGTAVPMMVVRLTLQPLCVCRAVGLTRTAYARAFVPMVGATLVALAAPVAGAFVFRPTGYVSLTAAVFVSSTWYAAVAWRTLFAPPERQLLSGVVARRWRASW